MNRFISIAATGMLAAGLTVGSLPVSAFTVAAGEEKLKIVTTIFPEYDWVMSVLGDRAANAEVTMLLDNGVDLHSYQPVAEDILKIATCDLFIYVGGESDGWVDDALQESMNPDMAVINLMEVLGDDVEEEEIVEGMQEEEHHHDHDGEEEHDHEEDADHDHEEETEHDHDETEHDQEDAEHDHEEDADHDHEEEPEYDEHVWLSLRKAGVLVDTITQALSEIDPDNASVYEENAKAYTKKLDTLDGEYEKAVSEAEVKTLLFGDRFPFRYMTDDYGLTYYAAFVGCSAETEASFETIMFLAQKVDELSLKAVMTIEGNDHKIAETIVQSTKDKDQKILTMNSMQATTSEDVAEGDTYLSIMEENLSVLKEALQ